MSTRPMMPSDADLAEAAADVPESTDAQKKSVVELARKQLALEHRLVELAVEADNVSKELTRVAETELPEAMKAIFMTEFALANGYRVTVKQKVYAAFPAPASEDDPPEDATAKQDRYDQAVAYVRKLEADDLFKTTITAKFGRGEEALAERVLTFLRGINETIDYTHRVSVHPSTLGAFIREKLTAGAGDFSPEKLGARVVDRAKVTAPKIKKVKGKQ